MTIQATRAISKFYMRLLQAMGILIKIAFIVFAFSRSHWAVTAALLFLLAIAIFVNRRYLDWLEIKEYNFSNPKLAGLTILHITDLHNRTNQKKIQQVCTKHRPDLVLDTGDAVDELSTRRSIKRVLDFYRSLPAPLYRINGNHEFSSGHSTSFRSACEQIGVKYVDRLETINVGDYKLKISDHLEDVADITLIHNPVAVDRGPVRSSLILAGHTHGGGIWPLGQLVRPVADKSGLKYASGKFQLGKDRYLIVSKGVGCSVPKLRFRCRPDVSIIKFTK